MQWISLGHVNPTDQWQSFPIDAIGGETFRVIQAPSNSVDRAYIGQYFPLQGGIVYPTKRIYSNQSPILFVLEIPPDFRNNGEITRTMMIRRKLPYYPSTWDVELQIYL